MGNFSLRKVADREAETIVDLTVGGDHTFVVQDATNSKASFIASNCWLTPIINYVTFDEFAKEWDKTHPTKFTKGEPVYDTSKLGPEDVIDAEVPTALTTFKNVPVEYSKPLEEATKVVKNSPYSKHAPKDVEFVKDVYEADDYQKKEKPQENQSGQVVSWNDPTEDKALFSSYAGEYDKIGDVYIRNWLSKVWAETPRVRDEWIQLFATTPDRIKVPAISPVDAELLRTSLHPYPIGQTYYDAGAGDGIGLTKKFRELTDEQATKRLQVVGLDPKDIETIVKWRRSIPLWDLKTGEPQGQDADGDDASYVSHEASMSPEAFFRESCLDYTRSPWRLRQHDPELYERICQHVFDGKEFK